MENPCSKNGFGGLTVCGVGIRKDPSGSFRFSRARAAELMLEPSDLMAVPPCTPVIPANNFASPEVVRSFVSGGSIKLAVHAVRDCPAAIPLI